MKLISHRGLIEGPNTTLENQPAVITYALQQGFDCEIDLWLVDNQLYLGHDNPQYHIGDGFLQKAGLWIHAKNIEAFHWLTSTDLNYFWHQNDWYTLTSHRFIWAYPGYTPTNKGVQVVPEMVDPELKNLDFNAYGVCSDWILKIQ
jgi:hypothetical protein